jgi:hypothetical protein
VIVVVGGVGGLTVVIAGGLLVVVPDGAVVDLTGVVGVIGEALGFLWMARATDRRSCPLGPEAEATAPKLMVAASAAHEAARR